MPNQFTVYKNGTRYQLFKKSNGQCMARIPINGDVNKLKVVVIPQSQYDNAYQYYRECLAIANFI